MGGIPMNKKSCNKHTEVYSRVVGFYRPTSLWNKGKKDEFKARKTYRLDLVGNLKKETQTESVSKETSIA